MNLEVSHLRAAQLRPIALLPPVLPAVPDRQLESALLTTVSAHKAEKLIFYKQLQLWQSHSCWTTTRRTESAASSTLLHRAVTNPGETRWVRLGWLVGAERAGPGLPLQRPKERKMEGNCFPGSPSHSSADDKIASAFTAVTKYLQKDDTIQYSNCDASNMILGQFAKNLQKPSSIIIHYDLERIPVL